jgi:ubiquinone/menaquinone biosynthesis C-methylase UbiE
VQPRDVARLASRYSADAEAYEELWVPEILPLGHRLADAMPISDAELILDLGAGVGALLPHLQSAAPRAVTVAGDRAPGMIARVDASFPRLVLDAMHLPIADASVDAVVMSFMLFHTIDPLDTLREVRRIIRDGGAVGVATWGASRARAAVEAWTEELEAHGATEEDALADHDRTDTTAKMIALLEAAGFSEVRTETVRSEHPVSLKEFVALRTRIGSFSRRLRSLPSDVRERCLARAIERVSSMDPGEFVDDVDAILSVAVA